MTCADFRPATAWLTLATLLALFWAAGAQAHTREVSYSFWTPSAEGIEVSLRISQRELTRLGLHPEQPNYAAAVDEWLRAQLRLSNVAGACQTEAELPPVLRDGQVLHRWQVVCEPAGNLLLELRRLFEVAPAHTHFATLRVVGAAPLTRILNAEQPSWNWAAPDEMAVPESLWGFLQLGIEHILGGWDHLAFLLALVVLAAGAGEVALLITGFTVGHSLTLALAVLGWAVPEATAVEVFIALSIVLLAFENAWRLDVSSRLPVALAATGLLLAALLTGALSGLSLFGLTLFLFCYLGLLRSTGADFRLRLLLTLAFGLFHGFGFAGVLAEMSLPKEQLATALFGFNLGVEAGQLMLLVVAWPLLRWLNRRGLPVSQAATAGAAGLGVYWFALRSLA